jgi:methyl-accepting chemotaxis protein
MKTKRNVLFLMIFGYLVPPLAWNLMMLGFRVIPNELFSQVLTNPIQAIYAIPVIILFGIFFNLRLKKEKFKSLPLLYLLSLFVFCIIGPNTGMIGVAGISKQDFILGNIFSLPLVFLFSVPVFLLVLRQFEKHLSFIKNTDFFFSLQAKTIIGIVCTFFGGLVLAIGINAAITLDPLKNNLATFIRYNAVFFVLTFAISIFNTMLLTRQITKPLSLIMEALHAVFLGDKNTTSERVDLTKEVAVDAKDELGLLSGFFNKTFESIRVLVELVRRQTMLLQNSGVNLSSNVEETASAINEISATILSINSQSINQSSSVTKTVEAVQAINNGIDRLNDLIENQVAAVTQSSSAIEEMMANIASVTQMLVKNSNNIQSLNESSVEGRDGLQKIVEDIHTIATESQSLLEISSIIQGIASQTNLLAMNAAIEAAHAGSAGKGFAVVADEVRKLAELSTEQVKIVVARITSIKKLIEAMTGSADAVIKKFDVIEQNVDDVKNQGGHIQSAMEEQSEGSRQILISIGELNTITQNIKEGSNEMLSGSRQLIAEADTLTDITHEITQAINEMATSSEQITTAVTEVNELTQENKISIDSLAHELEKFIL